MAIKVATFLNGMSRMTEADVQIKEMVLLIQYNSKNYHRIAMAMVERATRGGLLMVGSSQEA